ncbi:hypothetical protein GCM10027570_11940 [Streptomonospora sediminis]
MAVRVLGLDGVPPLPPQPAGRRAAAGRNDDKPYFIAPRQAGRRPGHLRARSRQARVAAA